MSNTVSQLISDEQLNRIIQIESAGNPNAKAGTSSAAGLGQFITDTWLGTVRKHRPDIARANTRDQLIAMRVGTKTAALQLEILACFTEDNAHALGAGFTDGDLYLAHFLGLGDARNLFRAPPDDMASAHVTAKAVKANKSILAGKTCAEVRVWAQGSMQARWDRAGRTDWVKKFHPAPAAAAAPPVVAPQDAPGETFGRGPMLDAIKPTPIALPAPPKKRDGWASVIIAAIIAAAAAAYNWAMEHLPEIFLAVVAALVLAAILFRWRKGHWPWISPKSTGPLLPASSAALPPSLVVSSAQRSRLSAALSDLSQAAQLPPLLVQRPRPTRSRQKSKATRARPTSSQRSKPRAAKKSAPKPKSRSRR